MKNKWELWYCKFEFEPRDLWVGAYWKTTHFEPVQNWPVPSELDIWVCLLPMIPLHLRFIDKSAETPDWQMVY